MTAPIGGSGFWPAQYGVGGPGQKPLGLDVAGEGAQRPAFTLPSEGPSFGDTLKQALGQVSAASDTANDYVQRFVRGEPVELHQVMAATEEAGLAIEMLVELRNKFTEAYRTIASMQ